MDWPFDRSFNVWDPWSELKQLQNNMDRLLRRYDTGKVRNPAEYPAVNIWSDDNQVLLTAEVAGLDPDKIELSVHSDQLTIKGSRDSYECSEKEVYHRRERGCGSFVRTVGLPFVVENDKVEATYKGGILKVVLPRAEADKPKQISIKTD